mmetsp:Transcript_1310/g.2740  ORF Transcript_1310/g.2740 Transcript_1310/m.2740 type:complete len:81 (-) Transcript_1310:675-917(-)
MSVCLRGSAELIRGDLRSRCTPCISGPFCSSTTGDGTCTPDRCSSDLAREESKVLALGCLAMSNLLFNGLVVGKTILSPQ